MSRADELRVKYAEHPSRQPQPQPEPDDVMYPNEFGPTRTPEEAQALYEQVWPTSPEQARHAKPFACACLGCSFGCVICNCSHGMVQRAVVLGADPQETLDRALRNWQD